MDDKAIVCKVGRKGSMTLPKEVCKRLNIKAGDYLLVRVEPEEYIILEKAVIATAKNAKI